MSAQSITLAPSSAATQPIPGPPPQLAPSFMLEGPILPTLLRLSTPNVLNLLAIAGMITFDGLFMGRLGADALAGVSLAFPFVMLMQHTAASGMGGGVSSAIARALGAGKRDVANALVLHTLVLALGLAVVFSTVSLLAAPTLFRWMGGHGAMLTAAMNYANVAFSAAVSICMLNLLGSAVRGTGNMALPAAVIVGCVLGHILISPLLIFAWGPFPALGPAGAGWGLMASFGVGSLVSNWGARQFRRAREIAWTGAATIAATCAVIGIFFAVFPTLWLHLFTDAEDIIALGTSYLRVVGPIYSLYGLGMGLYFATQGFGNALWTVAANAVRVLVSSAIALIAVYWLGLGALGFFVSIAVGFCTYAALTLVAALRVREPLPAQVA